MPAPRPRNHCASWLAARSASARAVATAIVVAATGSAAFAEGLGTGSAFDGASAALDALQRGLERHPSIKLAGAAALIVPILAVVAALARFVARRHHARRSSTTMPACEPVSAGTAWIEVAGRAANPVAVGELVRIGRSDECDLALEHDGLAEMHAVIERTPDREFILFDVSSGTMSLAVNGAPARRCRLSDGDRIEIGSACVVFRTAGPGAAPGSLPVAAVNEPYSMT